MISVPNRSGARWERDRLSRTVPVDPAAPLPARLSLDAIKQAPNLFQPRFDSIAYAPGRSEAHIADLGRMPRNGRELDPVTVVAFGTDWFLVDGHHRVAAYQQAGWAGDIPVQALASPLQGTERVDWAVQQSFADNVKSRLNISTSDKADGAWLAVALGSSQSKAKLSAAFGVSARTIATMRTVRSGWEALGIPAATFAGWRTARNELKRRQDGETDHARPDFDYKRRREAAKRLTPVMDMRLPPDQLADALEQFSPGIVEAMAAARARTLEDAD